MDYKNELQLTENNKFQKYMEFGKNKCDNFNEGIIDEMKPIINYFVDDPFNIETINDLIEIAKNQAFPVPESFLITIFTLLGERIHVDECICLLGRVFHFPIGCFIDSFPDIKVIIEITLTYINISSEAITILIFFLQNIKIFPNIDKIFLDLDVIQQVEKQLENNDKMIIIQSLIFFRYLLKIKLPFLDDILEIYYKILRMAMCTYNIFAIHTIYHFAKRYIKFNNHLNRALDKENNINKYNLSKNLIFSELFDIQLETDSPTFLLYLMKYYYLVSKIKKIYHYNSKKIKNILPLMFTLLQKPDQKIVDYSLLFIYNILRDGKEKAYYTITKLNPELIMFLLQNYENYAFNAQREIVFIFIEYSYYMDANSLNSIFEKFSLYQIFGEIGLSEDRNLLEDFFLCFLNIYETFEASNPNYLKYFKDEDFVNMVQSIDKKDSSYYDDFYKILSQLLQDEI